MKQFNSFKTFLLVALMGTASAAVQAQNYHPAAFGTMGGAYSLSNWYANYVGLNVLCTAPPSVAGSLLYTTPGGAGTGAWGGVVTTPLVNDLLIVPQFPDSCACTSITVDMTGKIALVWRGPEPPLAPCEFGLKALHAQEAGAIACVIINEYTGSGPIGMAAGASGGTVTIPVFMIANIPGAAMYSAITDGPVDMTISPWGVGQANDLGFVPGGIAGWANYAVPWDQLTAPTPVQYIGLDGAFVANYGSKTETNVKVNAALTFTPTGSSTAIAVNSDVTNNLASFPTSDSIWAMFVPATYPVTASTTGRFDLTYTITSDSTDGAPANNTAKTSFYASDSVYSKGTYDFNANVPLSTFPTSAVNASGTAEDFVWGNMYHVNHGGNALSAVQFSLNNGFAGPFSGSTNVLIFKWTDGSNGLPFDSVVENGELDCISLAQYNFQPTDTSGTIIKTAPLGHLNGLGDTLDGTYRGPVLLQDNSDYLVAVNVVNGMSIYCDGQLDPYPRVFGRFMSPTAPYFDYSSVAVTGDYSPSTPGVQGTLGTDASTQGYPPIPFGGVHFINAVDSFNYNEMKGLIPSIALIVIDSNRAPIYVSGVKNTTNTSKELNIFPIPTSDNLTVSLNLSQMSSTVTYTILDGLARFVDKETHNNVQSEQFNIPTSNLPAGTYFLIVNANGKAMSRKFVVVR